MRILKKGATSQTLYFSVNDSASTSGGKKTGIVFNTTSLVASYTRNGAARTAITLATLASASAAWSSGGFVEVDATNEPGLYRLDVPDAAFATGVDSTVVQIGGATGMVWSVEEVQLVAIDLQDATALGVSRIDAAISSRMATFTLPTNFAAQSIDASGRVDVGKVTGTAQTARDLGANLDATVSSRLAFASIQSRNSAAQGGTATSITLDAGASAVTDFYVGQVLFLNGGTGAGQSRFISAYNGSTKVATVSRAWATNPDATSTFNITGLTDSSSPVTVTTNNDKTGYALTAGEHTSIQTDVTSGLTTQGYTATRAGYLDTLNGLVQAIWDKATSALTTVGSIGKLLVTDLDATVSSRLATSGYTAPLTTTQVENAVWDATAASHVTAGSTGAKLTAAANAGDPMATAVPGAYAAGTAGFIIGNLPGSVWDVAIASHTSAGSVGNKLNSLSGASGSGALTVTVTVQNDVSHPVAGAQFWVTTDVGGTNIVASGTTDTFGKVTVFLNAGTYFGFASKPGESFANPATLVVA